MGWEGSSAVMPDGFHPFPFPNTEVKSSKANDTAAVRQWESRDAAGILTALART